MIYLHSLKSPSQALFQRARAINAQNAQNEISKAGWLPGIAIPFTPLPRVDNGQAAATNDAVASVLAKSKQAVKHADGCCYSRFPWGRREADRYVLACCKHTSNAKPSLSRLNLNAGVFDDRPNSWTH